MFKKIEIVCIFVMQELVTVKIKFKTNMTKIGDMGREEVGELID